MQQNLHPDLNNIENLEIFKTDQNLLPFKGDISHRLHKYKEKLEFIVKNESSIENFARSYKNYGINVTNEGILYREWLPEAKEVYLFGDFNNWNRKEFPLKKCEWGVWEIQFNKNHDGTQKIPHNSKIKISILGQDNQYKDKIPAWIQYAIQNEDDKVFNGVFWNPPQPYQIKFPKQERPSNLKIYELHIGMAGIEQKVHSYKECMNDVLPRIKRLGYNAIQMMAIMEHAYYGSFGYHVTNFFAISSRQGTPDELKELIDKAHELGIYVLMDLVHSHASSNTQDGLYMLDGSDYQYFHSGARGRHELWDSQLFDYDKYEVLRFLLSNLAFYMDVYNFDGFRFDGITSMMYHHHGLSFGFTGAYHEYFSTQSDIEAQVYLMLANHLIHTLNTNAITIAEDVSGFPTLGASIQNGGIGFDYRLAMALPDMWIKILKEKTDEQWDMKEIVYQLTNKRWDEKVIAYVESHDQALVGDKTLSMQLLDSEIYFNMSCLQNETPVVSRGIAFHKMIRLLTLGLGGDAYLTFMGNEFGHPEWIDFPREGNNWSYQHCIRRWDLADDTNLRYKYLLNFDQAMINTENQHKFLNKREDYVTLAEQNDKIIVFERANLLFIFNFHATQSYEHYKIGTQWKGEHKMVLNTDLGIFGGYDRVNNGNFYPVVNEPWQNRENHIKVYLPSRCAMVLSPENTQ